MRFVLVALLALALGFVFVDGMPHWVHCGCKAKDCTWPCRPEDPNHGCCEPGLCDCMIPNPGR